MGIALSLRRRLRKRNGNSDDKATGHYRGTANSNSSGQLAMAMARDGSRAGTGQHGRRTAPAVLLLALLVPAAVSAVRPSGPGASSRPSLPSRALADEAVAAGQEQPARTAALRDRFRRGQRSVGRLSARRRPQGVASPPAMRGSARPVRMAAESPASREDLMALYRKQQEDSVVELPTAQQARAWREKMKRRALDLLGPPKKLGIMGLPNTGTNAVAQLVGASFDVEAKDGVNGTWKHLLPFHPAAERELSRLLTAEQPVYGAIFIVRHPLAWMQAETSEGHGFGLRCDGQMNWPGHNRFNASPACFWETCHSYGDDEFCNKAEHPRGYRLPSLIDSWVAYVSHIFDSPRTLVVRYEDLLQDTSLLVDRVARRFKLTKRSHYRDGHDPLSNYTRAWDAHPSSSGIGQSRERWQSYVKFWGSLGTHVDTRRPRPQQAANGDQQCLQGIAPRHYLVMPANQRSLKSGLDRGIVQQHLDAFGYGVPQPELLDTMWRKCSAVPPEHPAPKAAPAHSAQPSPRWYQKLGLLRG